MVGTNISSSSEPDNDHRCESAPAQILKKRPIAMKGPSWWTAEEAPRAQAPKPFGTNKTTINLVSESTGLPLSLKKAEQGYTNNLGCILHEMVSINEPI